MRMIRLFPECCSPCEASSVSGAGATIASARQTLRDVTSGIPPSKSACNSREGEGLAPSLGKVAQTQTRPVDVVPESRNVGKTSDAVSARSFNRSWNGCSALCGCGRSSALSAHSTNWLSAISGAPTSVQDAGCRQLCGHTYGRCVSNSTLRIRSRNVDGHHLPTYLGGPGRRVHSGGARSS